MKCKMQNAKLRNHFARGKMNLNGKVRRVQEGKRTSPPRESYMLCENAKALGNGLSVLPERSSDILHFAFCTLHLAFTP